MEDTRLRDLLTNGETGLSPALVAALPTPWRFGAGAAPPYDLADAGLVTAVKAAMLLGQPLILAGEPGVGKTSLAQALATRLGLPLHPAIQVKSGTGGLELFYSFDEVARFRDASRHDADAPSGGLCRYVRFTALGRAILWSAGPDARLGTGSVGVDTLLGKGATAAAPTLGTLFPHEFDASGDKRAAARSIVLIDELDKAPKDAPNDILGEIEALSFRIPELDIAVTADHARWPLVLITSNSERSFPDAFLRRCVFHWIDYPDAGRLQRIAASRIAGGDLSSNDVLISSAVALFDELREAVENKKPSTAELISFVTVLLESGWSRSRPVDLDSPEVQRVLGVLIKTDIDRQAIARLVAARGSGTGK